MQIKRFLSLCVVATLICSCTNDVVQKSNRTIVSGEVINRTANDPTVMVWNLCDPFNNDRIGVRLSEDGRFWMETEEVNLFHNMTLKYNKFISFFAAPGDSIHMIIDVAKMKVGALDAVHFSGDRAEENNELYIYYAYTSNILSADLRHNRLDMNVEPKAMITQLNERLTRYEDSLSVYEKRQKIPMSDELRDFMRRNMIFGLASRLVSYKRDNINVRFELLSNPFFGINDSLNFNTLRFPYHLQAYMRTKFSLDTTLEKRLSSLMELRNRIRILMNEPASFSRDVMIWQSLSPIIKVFPKLYDSIPEMQTVFTNSQLNKKFFKFVQQSLNENVEFPETKLDGISYLDSDGTVTVLAEGDIFVYLAHKYPDQVLYIDVYSTWCGPCIGQMEHAPTLYNLMKGKDVVFVNFCLESNVAEWRKVITRFDLTENYFFDSDVSKLFMTTYKILGFPTYILIGKDGKIETLQATRPSHLVKDSQQIDDLLEND